MDLDFAVGILRAMEDDEAAEFDVGHRFPNYDPESPKYGHHCRLLREAGLIEAWDVGTFGNPMAYYPKLLTWNGYAFIATYRDKTTLKKVLDKLRVRGMEVTIQTLIELAKQGLSQFLQ